MTKYENLSYIVFDLNITFEIEQKLNFLFFTNRETTFLSYLQDYKIPKYFL
jgi:hypothetical protein